MVELVQPKSSRASDVRPARAAQGGLGGILRERHTHMNTRSSLLTVGVSALLVTGSAFAAAPASAAPNSQECLTAQSALSAQLGVASVDLAIANELRAAISVLDTVGPQLAALWDAADASLADEEAAIVAAEAAVTTAFDNSDLAEAALANAQELQFQAQGNLEDANEALEADPENVELQEAVDAAERALTDANAAVAGAETAATDAAAAIDPALAAVRAAYEALEAASIAAYNTAEITALEAQSTEAFLSIEASLAALGATPGTDPDQLIALADAAIAACSGAAVKPAAVVAPQQRGLNVQTAGTSEAGATDPANLALLGLAGLGAMAAAGAVVVRRRSARS